MTDAVEKRHIKQQRGTGFATELQLFTTAFGSEYKMWLQYGIHFPVCFEN
jgi:hypothetical protein